MAGVCDDGDPCTTVDACAGGLCRGRLYTAAEAKNWAFAFGGDDEDAAFAATLRDDGNVEVVGAFHGSATLPGGLTLEAPDAAPHGFWIRVTPRGQVVRAVVVPPDTAPGAPAATFEVAMAVGVSNASDNHTVIGLIRKNETTTSSRVVWMNDNGSVRKSVGLPGTLRALDVHPDGSALVLLEIKAPITLDLTDGSHTMIEPGSSRGTVVVRVSSDGIAWGKGFGGPGTSTPVSLVALGEKVAFSVGLEGATSFAGLSFPDDGSSSARRFVMTADGVLESHDGAGLGAFYARWKRAHLVEEVFELVADDEMRLTAGPATSELVRTCSVSAAVLNPDGSGPPSAFGYAVPVADGGFLLHGHLHGEVAFPLDFKLDGGADSGFFVVFDSQCRTTSGWLAMVEDT